MKFRKGKKRPKEIGKKISKKKKGIKFSKKHIKNLSKSHKGYKFPDKRKKQLSERNKKLGIRPPIKYGKDHHNWLGGISGKPYTYDWKRIRKRIRKRDNYICQECGKKEKKKAFDIHHIDYDKKNNNSDNLITLCKSCHMKTNFKRNNWIKYFYDKSLCRKYK